MNATMCDHCGAVERGRPTGWFLLRRFAEDGPSILLPNDPEKVGTFCSLPCLTAAASS